jgi:hypothetical protein
MHDSASITQVAAALLARGFELRMKDAVAFAANTLVLLLLHKAS